MAGAPGLNSEHRELRWSYFDWYFPQHSALATFKHHWIGLTADFVNHRGMRRIRCLSAVAASFLVSQLVALRIQDIKYLQYSALLVGISYGGVFGLMPTIIIEWFGMGS